MLNNPCEDWEKGKGYTIALTLDINSPRALTGMIALGTVGVLSFIVLPGLVQGYVSQLGLSEADANQLAFIEMLGVATATVIAAFVTHFFNWRHLLVGAIILAALGNFVSGFAADVKALGAIRFVTGLGEGGIIGLSFTYVGLTAKPERNLAWYLACLLTYGALGLWLMPSAFAAIGLKGIFFVWALITAISLIAVRATPASSDSRAEASPTATQMSLSLLGFALLGVLAYNVAIGIYWANLFLIGMEIRPDEQSIANALLLAQFVAIPGALIAAFVADRINRWLPVAVGILAGAGFIALLMSKPEYTIYVVAACGFNFMWNMALPFILGAVNDMDEHARMVTPAIAMQMIGLGLGPLFGAILLGDEGGFRAIEELTVQLLLVSFIVLSLCIGLQRRTLKRIQSAKVAKLETSA